MRNVIIIGSGPAGYTAALYAARANLAPLMIEGEPRGTVLPGGQLMLTSDVENYPGFEHGVQGPELMRTMRAQAERFGAEIVPGWVEEVDFTRAGGPHRARFEDRWEEARAVIIATGASPRLIDHPAVRPPDEGGLMSRGISTCATCDGAFFKGADIAVLGGGDSAMEEGSFLTRYGKSVTIVHRREEFRASKIMLDRARKNPKIRWELGKTVADIEDVKKGRVTGVVLEDVKDRSRKRLPVGALFIAIGHDPNTALFRGKLDLDPAGYILHREHTMTNVRGVFASGDCVDHRYRQAVTAAGMGCQAAIDAEKYLESLGH
ncbi:MAG: thioredoxin-disulfide reductase [Planctomycetales bacterium]|nr:thioredoxin-disulfide reductase [Planctomycetales bacterium]